LKKAFLFQRLFKEGRYYKGDDFSLRVLENNLAVSRLGIAIQSKLFSGAVERNRAKRLIREAFRKNKALFNNYYDIIIRPKSAQVAKKGCAMIENNILELFKAARILK
jgi:ribonuclease P protein component